VADRDGAAAFVAAADELHLGRAAEGLGVPRTTLAARLRRFEAELGLTLLDRTHRSRIVLTQAGVATLPQARRLVEAADALAAKAEAVRSGCHGVVRVGLASEPDQEIDELVEVLRGVDAAWAVVVTRLDVHEARRLMVVGGLECTIGRGVGRPGTRSVVVDPRAPPARAAERHRHRLVPPGAPHRLLANGLGVGGRSPRPGPAAARLGQAGGGPGPAVPAPGGCPAGTRRA
jgi:DNA-binding transcriptional LysR family regulator